MTSFREKEHQGWAEKAPFYDEHFAGVTRQAIGPILEGLGDISGRNLLDICCGTGDLAEAATQKGAHVTGVDFAEPMIEIARERVPTALFDVGDAEKLSFEDAGFDAATCLFGLWHVGEPDSAISEAARVLKPGGAYSYTAWLPPAEGWDMMGLLMTAINNHGTMDVDLPPAPPPFRFAQENEAADALQSSGFGSVTFQKKMAIWIGKTGDDLLDLLYKGIVRAPMLIEAQTPESKQAIINDIRSGAETFREGEEIKMRRPSHHRGPRHTRRCPHVGASPPPATPDPQ
ncbi:UbiE/COQ5 methyltransferase [Stappia aggregata IAM 12614]|uniref:UbiE/COQ5 methyltransferase n=1 Tax=Roseibium aggregatum (strain ATCC 25650 / DSM 13394 / JCM 20685 / NBRC 16684 / NCIMB 2208 / IAM 12614 / B1) TaxID=384765 RepID=A0P0Z1_ROSAI|nr:methyltransferase domain-containing protein [Roseibium aggregatum]EAV41176.1 UbiE/COQ5 methyltransferase [Stappia aggregata IAM 12614] [Roseibium aggregatum IAM 12614]